MDGGSRVLATYYFTFPSLYSLLQLNLQNNFNIHLICKSFICKSNIQQLRLQFKTIIKLNLEYFVFVRVKSIAPVESMYSTTLSSSSVVDMNIFLTNKNNLQDKSNIFYYRLCTLLQVVDNYGGKIVQNWWKICNGITKNIPFILLPFQDYHK